MKLLLFILRLLIFFLGLSTDLWKHLGGLQANEQWKIPAHIAIENVNPDRILIDFRGEKIEIPRLFKQRRKYENVILCLYDPAGHGESQRDAAKDLCRWRLTVAPHNAYAKIESIENLKSLLTKIPSSVTLDVIYHGHGRPGGFNIWSYEEFTRQLATLTAQIDNMNIDLNTCYGGGFWNCTYTKSLQKVRVVSGSSKNGAAPSYSSYMRSINPPVFENTALHRHWRFSHAENLALAQKELETSKTIQDLEKFQGVNNLGSSFGVWVFYGHAIDLQQIPEINDMPPDDELFDKYFQKLGSFEPFKPGVFRRNASQLNIATTLLEVGEDLDLNTLRELISRNPNSQILTDARDTKINGKKISAFEIERARQAMVYVEPENFDKNGEVCGNNALSFLECREWAKKFDLTFEVWNGGRFPKGCSQRGWQQEDLHTRIHLVRYNFGSGEANAWNAPVCKTHDLDHFILYIYLIKIFTHQKLEPIEQFT